MSTEKLNSPPKLEQLDREKILKRIQILLKAEHLAAKKNGSVEFDFDRGDFVNGEEYEKEVKKYIESMKEISLSGSNYKILGWDIFQMEGEKDTDCATIMTVLESEIINPEDIPESYELFFPNITSNLQQEIYGNISSRISNGRVEEISSFAVTQLDGYWGVEGIRIYHPVIIDGQFPEMLEQVRTMQTREILPLSEDIEIPF